MLEVFFPAKITSVDVGGVFLAKVTSVDVGGIFLCQGH